jgi:protein O-mannosyl-transferase
MAKKIAPKVESPIAPKTATQPFWQQSNWMSIGLVLFSFILYYNTLRHQFTLDDPIVMSENMFTTKGLAGIKDIWTHDSFFGFFKSEEKIQLVTGGRYRPFTPTLFAIGWQFFGNSPVWGHFLTILFYGLTGVMLYQVLLRLLKDKPYQHHVSIITSVLFITHPIHTEAIANIKGLDEVMTLFLTLCAVAFSFKAFDTPSNKLKYNLIAGLLFFFALTSKENAIMFIFIVPLMYYYFTTLSINGIIRQTLYFIAPAFIFILIRGAIIGWQFHTNLGELMNNPFIKIENGNYLLYSTAERLATVFYTLGKYIVLLLFPHPLTHDYYPRQIAMMKFSDWQVLCSILAYVLLIFWVFKSLKNKHLSGFAIAFYLISLAIVSNLFFPIGTNMGERFVFMPSVGFCLLIAHFGNVIFKEKRQLGIISLALVVVLYSFKTIDRNQAWKDNYTLFKTDIFNSPNSAKLRNALGGETIAQAQKEKDPEQQAKMFEEALVHLEKAVELHPKYKNAYLLIGNAYNYKKNFEKAIENYKKCLEIDPTDKDAIHNLSITYRYFGIYYLEQKKDIPNAIACLEQVYRYKPNDVESWRCMGIAAGLKGDHQNAIAFFNKIIAQNPKDAKAFYDLGTAYLNAGNVPKATEMRQKAAELGMK